MEFKCRAPWEGLFVNPDGDLRVCCAGRSLGNLNKNSLQELLEAGPLAKLREDMLTKGSSDYCTSCHDQHQRTGKSLRDLYNEIDDELQVDKFIPKSVDIRWHNTCQLRCNYCNPEWSSAYASWKGIDIKVSETQWQDEVLQHIKNNTTRLHDIQMLGGEPLLLRENIDLLELVDDNTRIGIVTNLSVKNIEDLPVYKKLVEIDGNVAWLVSFENIGDHFEYVRRNATWSLTESNYKKLKESVSSPIGVHFTYTLMSAFTLVDVFDWLYSIDPNPNNNTSFISTLDHPPHLDLMNYPKEIKEKAIEQIDIVQTKYKDYINQKTAITLEALKKEIGNRLKYHNISVMKDFTKEVILLDEDHPRTFAELWPFADQIIRKYLN